MPELILKGCTPEPLMSYLKALGILRLVSEQVDSETRGFWRNDTFVLQCSIDEEELRRFFLSRYRPTPVIGPWAGGSGFFSKDNKKAIECLVSASSSERCRPYQNAIESVRAILDRLGISEKPSPEQKTDLLRRLRSELPQDVLLWMDAAIAINQQDQGFAPLLGTGGNDGRFDFTQNFMMRLVTLGIWQSEPVCHAAIWLDGALLGTPILGLTNAAVGQFAPGRAGGPNATQGMEGDALDNPWDFVLMIEGALMLGAAATRRFGTRDSRGSAFPFTVRSLAVGTAVVDEIDSNEARGEIWLPIWGRPASLRELRTVFAEGRADILGRPVRNSVDFARAVSGLGVDRGIEQFTRVSFLKRSGKAFLACPLGRIAVGARHSIDLVRQLDPWLDGFRRACAGNVPQRFKAVLQSIDRAIFDYCLYSGPRSFQGIAIALGRAERKLAESGNFRRVSRVPPVYGLSSDWISAANDNTPEFEIALGLSGIYDSEKKVSSLRTNLEPVVAWRKKDGSLSARWAEENPKVVWNSADLSTNIASALRRRIVDGNSNGCSHLPISALNFISLDNVSRFLAGQLDEQRIEDLLWALILIPQTPGMVRCQPFDADRIPPLPRVFALLKLLFLPEPLTINRIPTTIAPESSLVPLITGGCLSEACVIAMRRLRSSSLVPLPYSRNNARVRDREWEDSQSRGQSSRLAAALLFPLSQQTVDRLRAMILRDTETRTNN